MMYAGKKIIVSGNGFFALKINSFPCTVNAAVVDFTVDNILGVDFLTEYNSYCFVGLCKHELTIGNYNKFHMRSKDHFGCFWVVSLSTHDICKRSGYSSWKSIHSGRWIAILPWDQHEADRERNPVTELPLLVEHQLFTSTKVILLYVYDKYPRWTKRNSYWVFIDPIFPLCLLWTCRVQNKRMKLRLKRHSWMPEWNIFNSKIAAAMICQINIELLCKLYWKFATDNSDVKDLP